MNETDKLLVAYIAGFVDGEGSISVFARKSSRHDVMVCLQVSQVDPRPLLLMQQRYGGSLSQHANNFQFKNSQPIWRYRLECRKVLVCLEELVPYLVLKKDKAERAIAVQRMKRVGGSKLRYSEEERNRISSAVVEFKKCR